MSQSFEQTITQILHKFEQTVSLEEPMDMDTEDAIEAIMTAHKAEVERKLNSLEVVRGDRDKDELTITFRSFDAALESEERI